MQDLDRKPQRHILALDGVRGVAILMVLGVHFLFVGEFPEAPPRWLSVFHVLNFGWMGVDLFFVLSGFLITGILLDTKASPDYFRSFYGRRTLRIFPLYYLVVLVWLFTLPWQGRHLSWLATPMPIWPVRLSYVVYMNNWVLPFQHGTGGLLTSFWSLAVEEQFYLLWPAVVLLLSRRRLAQVTLAICLAMPVLRSGLDLWNHIMVFMSTLTRMDTLLWGALAALAVRRPGVLPRLLPWLGYVMAGSAGLMLIIAFPLHEFYSRVWWTQSIGFTIIAVGFTAFLLRAYHSDPINGPLARVLRWQWLRSFGRYSYGIYVFHTFPVVWLEHRFRGERWFGHSLGRGLLLFFAGVALSYAIAWVSFHAYEQHFLRLKRYFEPRFRDPATLPRETA